MNIDLVKVTPELAEQWLSANTVSNRKISKITVKRYAKDMVMGRWLVTGESIKFDVNGKLIDGQHRLAAVVAARNTVAMYVITGLPNETILVIDTGKSRTSGDALMIAGHSVNSNEIAALARKIIGYKSGNQDILGVKKIVAAGAPITNREIVDFCANNDLSVHTSFAQRAKRLQLSKILSVGEYAFFHSLLSQIHVDDAEKFLTMLSTMEDVSAQSPIRVLFYKLTKSLSTLDSKMTFSAVIQAWNAWRSGTTITTIHVGRVDLQNAIPNAI